MQNWWLRKMAKAVGSRYFQEHRSMMARLRWMLPLGHEQGRRPMLADSLVWPSGWPLTRQSTNVFMSARRTVVPTIRCGEITRRSISPCPSTNGRGYGRRHRVGTSPMWIDTGRVDEDQDRSERG